MKSLRVLLLLVVIISTLEACRKGPEDPLLSFVTRKNRISKEWRAYSYQVNGVEKLLDTNTIVIDQASCGIQTIERFDSLDITMTFEKSGEYSANRYEYLKEVSTTTNPGEPVCTALIFNKELESNAAELGFWNFSGGVGSTSSREQVFIYVQETGMGVLWDIVRLANDELKIKRRYIKSGESVFTTEEIWFLPAE